MQYEFMWPFQLQGKEGEVAVPAIKLSVPLLEIEDRSSLSNQLDSSVEGEKEEAGGSLTG